MNIEEKYICPCCGYRTFTDPTPGSFDICPVCFWEDDNIQYNNPFQKGGANNVSLNEARKNYEQLGVMELRLKGCVRGPTQEEKSEKVKREK